MLVDCGLFQGAETSPEGRARAGKLAIDFSLDGIKALVATHVHIDHVGRIPYLLAAGFKGPILCSEPSAKLLPIVLEDAFKLGFSRDQKQVERYLKLIEQRIVALPYKQWFSLIDTPQLNARIRLQRAGHILGSAYVEVDLQYPETGEKKRIVFSGDLGAPHAPILPAPKAPYKADILVIESTYGDRLHEDRRSRRARHDVLFVGYQAEGTPGRQIQRFGPRSGYVEFDGQRYDIRAQVHTIGGYSAHADQAGLLSFVTGIRYMPSEVRVVHGELEAKIQLADAIQKHYHAKGQVLCVVVAK